MKLLRPSHINEQGFGWHIILPVLVFIAVAAIGIRLLRGSYADSVSTSVNTTVTVNPSSVVATVPSRYAGLSFETSSLCDLTGDWDTPVFQRLVENLSPQVIRIGGNSADQAYWEPTNLAECGNTKTVLNPQLVESFFSLAHTMDAKVIWTLNLGNYAPTTYSNEAAYVINEGKQVGGSNGSYLWALGMGNEPDLYTGSGVRPAGWLLSGGTGSSSYISAWNSYRDTIRKSIGDSGFKFMGPDVADNSTWFTTFIDQEKTQLSYTTHHYYAIHENNPPCASTNGYSKDNSPCSNSIQDYNNDLLSSRLMTQAGTTIKSWVSDSSATPLAIDEANSVTGGGKSGVSNTFASSLWGLDFLYTALENGAKQVNFHDTGGAAYTPISFGNSGQATPQALYYAMLAFHYAAASGNIVSTAVSSPYNVTAHSVSRNDKLYVTIINKGSHTANVKIAPNTSYATATSITLTAPSLESTASAVTLGDASVGTDGAWTAKPTTLTTTSGNWVVSVPADSAMIVTFGQ